MLKRAAGSRERGEEPMVSVLRSGPWGSSPRSPVTLVQPDSCSVEDYGMSDYCSRSSGCQALKQKCFASVDVSCV